MRLIIISLAILISACSEDIVGTGIVDSPMCYSFDERQCEGNPWLSTPDDFNNDPEVKASALFDYLESQSISIQNTIAIVDENRIVCEACVVCPTGTTYFIVASSRDASTIESLDLLNLQEESCAQ